MIDATPSEQPKKQPLDGAMLLELAKHCLQDVNIVRGRGSFKVGRTKQAHRFDAIGDNGQREADRLHLITSPSGEYQAIERPNTKQQRVVQEGMLNDQPRNTPGGAE